MKSLIVLGTLLAILSAAAMPIGAEQPPPAAVGKLADQLHSWKIRVLPADEKNPPSRMLADDVRQGLRDANRRETRAWRELKNLDDWKNYVQPRIQALRKSLGQFPPPPKSLSVRVTKQLKGDGYWIDNIVFESRPGLLVTANLYLPARNVASMPGMLICHSHHNPKTQGELQDMGILWARLGCAVLVMDQLGHGERRQHPFINAGSYPKSFRVGRQDYYFRYNTGMQLYLVGESLSGWMAWDLMRGVDVLLMQPNIDPKKIVLLGAVAGGGDPAAAAGALDERITAVVPFNFGGPQPETTYPLPPNAEDSFNYAGGGSWESTRNLRLSARDGFLPWVIVGSIAPRRLIYGHEFTWDRDHDPVWARLQQIYRWYDVPDHLAFAHGRGKLSGQPPESSHCNNIGPVHRQLIYAALQRWFAIPPPAKENQERRSAEELQCLTEESKQKGKLACQLAREMGQKQVQTYRQKLALLPAEQRRRQLQQDWSRVLGWQDASAPKFTATPQKAVPHLDSVQVIAATLHTEPERNIVVPVLLLVPTRSDKKTVSGGGRRCTGRQRGLFAKASGHAGRLAGERRGRLSARFARYRRDAARFRSRPAKFGNGAVGLGTDAGPNLTRRPLPGSAGGAGISAPAEDAH